MMRKLLLLLLMPLAVLTAQAQSNDYNMVIELNNGTTITLGANDVRNLTFNGDALSISGNTIEDIIAALATKADKSEIEELRALINQFKDVVSKKTITVNGVSFKMVKVFGGTFQMGATSEQGGDSDSDERPVHYVSLSDYWIGETEVTQALWQAVMGSNPSEFTGDSQRPVENVSWNDCQTFIQTLNELTGMSFRLPTEAEWEFAARGGNSSQGYKYAGSNTVDNVAWYYFNSYALGSSSPDYGTHPVATKSPNELGLYDMSGNVWEWCQDWYGSYSSSAQTDPVGPSSGSNRLRRGGSWNSNTRNCRVAYRNYGTPSSRDNSRGLRLAF